MKNRSEMKPQTEVLLDKVIQFSIYDRRVKLDSSLIRLQLSHRYKRKTKKQLERKSELYSYSPD